MKRAIRRHHRFRTRRKAERVLRRLLDEHYHYVTAIKRAEHLTGCSCWMCGNPRKFFGDRTRQELRHANLLELANE